MDLRLHRHGRFRRWLGARLGGDEALGDRAWRRILHGFGVAALVYYAIPNDLFVVAPKWGVLLALLAAVLLLEGLRHAVGLQLPTIRPYEARRIGSFALYSVALVAALLLFPEPIGAAVILGTAVVDPVAGELRASPTRRRLGPGLPFALYAGLAFVGLAVVGGWPLGPSVALALLAAALGVAVEGPTVRWGDDDLAMILVPAVALWLVAGPLLGLAAFP
jgi:dolichol kinase